MFTSMNDLDLTKHKTKFSVCKIMKTVTGHFVYGVGSLLNVIGLMKYKEE
jgi:hypothetical protein